MTQEEKQILLKDLCSRVLYRPKGVFLHKLYDPEEVEIIGYSGKWVEVHRKGDFDEIPIELVRLYLRPMSSMTEKENEELKYVIELELQALEGEEGYNTTSAAPAAFEIDFYNKHHLDYRGLIEMGLALEAPEGMYE